MTSTLITCTRIGYNQGPRTCREVDPAMVRRLESLGFPRPIRSLSDPRLRLPELLLMNGWERHATQDSVTYSYVSEQDSDARQSVTFGDEGTREVVTEVDGRTHILRSLADGTVEELRR